MEGPLVHHDREHPVLLLLCTDFHTASDGDGRGQGKGSKMQHTFSPLRDDVAIGLLRNSSQRPLHGRSKVNTRVSQRKRVL